MKTHGVMNPYAKNLIELAWWGVVAIGSGSLMYDNLVIQNWGLCALGFAGFLGGCLAFAERWKKV